MAKRAREDAKQAAARRLAEHWRKRALEYLAMASGPEASMFVKAASTANRLAEHFERARASRFTSDFAITEDGRPLYAEIDGEPVSAGSFPRKP